MGYQALYRQYRPALFGEVIGQEHITTILKNQVASGHTSHAYLFSGTRGTGKTTVARILARAVNCLSPRDGEPCYECAACKAALDNSADIVELDAASNTGVDNMRDIIEKVRFTPLELKYKIYIIDEAHMLSGSAFNALLKTLEEPPAHAMFILATTEPQKILPTIISRCQRMDFHRISVEGLITCVSSVVKSAGAHIDDEGILAIARAADGGMRDALSLADQCISFVGGDVTAEDVYAILGSMDDGFLFDMADALIDGDAAAALCGLDRVVSDGRDLRVFSHDLALHFRSVLIAKLCGSCADILDCTKDAMDRYIAQAERCGETRLLRATELLMEAQQSMGYISLPRVQLESVMARIARPEDKKSVEDISERMEAMEQKLQSGVIQAQAAAPITAAQSAPAKAAPNSTTPAPAAAVPAPASPVVQAETPKAPKDIWNAMQREFQSVEPAAAVMMLKAVSCDRATGELIVGFDKKMFCEVLSTPKFYKPMDDILKKYAPELTLRLTVLPPKGAEEKARELFGDDLKIT